MIFTFKFDAVSMKSLLKHTGPRRVANVPTDDVFQLNAIDQVGAISNMMGWTMLKFDQVLDPVKLQETLVSLIKTGDWRKLGGRLRRNVRSNSIRSRSGRANFVS